MQPTILPAQIPAAIAASLRQLGAVIDPSATAPLYAPLQAHEPYAAAAVTRDQSFGSHPLQRLDVFTPATPAPAPRPILLFVHGGGFIRGDKRSADSPFYDNIMLWAAGSGLLGININYRLAPEHPWPAAQQDIAAALLWAQSHAAEYGGDPQRIILCGHSAGAAHIAQYLAHPTLRLGNDGVRGAILVSGIYDTVAFGDSPARQAYFGSDRAQIAARSAQAGLLQCGVPLLIAAAELDPPEFRQQAERLGVPHYLLAGHSHISEILAVNTGDTTLSGLMQAFAAQHA